METSGKFLKARCPRCKCVQTIFGKASTQIRCIKCNCILAKPSGGKTKVRSKVEEVLGVEKC